MKERECIDKIYAEAPKKDDGSVDWEQVSVINRIIARGIGGSAVVSADGDIVGVRIAMPARKSRVASPAGVIYGKKNNIY
jgi:hypothetical protein